MKPEESVFQILRETHMGAKLVSWYEKEEDAQTELQELQKLFPREDYRIEEGTDYIRKKCRGCNTIHAEMRYDYYGIETGIWCDKCYDDPKVYHYRKDKYFDPLYAGERLYPED